MNYREIALTEVLNTLRNRIFDGEYLGEDYKANKKPFTNKELDKFIEAYDKIVTDLAAKSYDDNYVPTSFRRHNGR